MTGEQIPQALILAEQILARAIDELDNGEIAELLADAQTLLGEAIGQLIEEHNEGEE